VTTSFHCRRLPLFLPLLLLTGCRTSSQPNTVAPPAPPPAVHSTFDGDRAFGMLKAQCDLGPRPPGSAAHEKCKTYILKQLTPNVDKIDTQTFSYLDSERHVNLHLTNIIGVINPTATKKILLFTHWDTRPTADMDLDHKDKPIVGADDGASGTATLLELARVLHMQRPNVGVVLLFVDGEDWGPGENKMYLGARYFAQHPGVYKPTYAILLDMIGQKDLQVHRELGSQGLHPDLNDKVWSAAAALGYSAQFPDSLQNAIGDDHVAFNDAGIPAIDLIDFDYAYWHTLQDTADKCSPQSLKAVGDVMAKVVSDEK
jgi:glutaminyl-peptide cyclotransferase